MLKLYLDALYELFTLILWKQYLDLVVDLLTDAKLNVGFYERNEKKSIYLTQIIVTNMVEKYSTTDPRQKLKKSLMIALVLFLVLLLFIFFASFHWLYADYFIDCHKLKNLPNNVFSL